MQHVVSFLSARDICAVSATCARLHMRDVWCAQIHTRFPYKQRAEHCAPYKFFMLLESRVADAPPHGRALTWPGMLCEDGEVPTDRDLIPVHGCAQRIAVPHADIILRGDIIETGNSIYYIFDGTHCIPTIREPWDDASNILNLESRVADAPPHGQARRFLAAFEPHENWDRISCDEYVFKHHQLGMLYVPRADLIIRGDILIDDRARMFIFDGYRCHHVPCINEVYQSLAVVFNIPFEFDITYYDRGIWRGCNIGFRIDARVKYEMTCDAEMSFSHDGKIYIIDTRADLCKSWHAMTCPDYYIRPRNCTTYHLELFD